MKTLKAKFDYEMSVPEYQKIERCAASIYRHKDNAALESTRTELFQRLIALECEQLRRKRAYKDFMKSIKLEQRKCI